MTGKRLLCHTGVLTMPSLSTSLLCLFVALLLRFAAAREETCSSNDGTCRASQECGVWFAKSSLPNAGLGMFAGRDFKTRENLTVTGDLAIPVVDIRVYHGMNWLNGWDSYFWMGQAARADYEGVQHVDIASQGFNVPNGFNDLENVYELIPSFSSGGLHRAKDPGAGAITQYHDRITVAVVDVEAGQELFSNYGDEYFHERAKKIGPIPYNGDLPKAQELLEKWNRLRNKHSGKLTSAVFKDMLETFVWDSAWTDKSRLFFALPKKWDATEDILDRGITPHYRSRTTRSIEYLEENGLCADHLREGQSTISQAGRGAFANRRLEKDSIVAPLPLLHIPERKHLEMYRRDNGKNVVKNSDIVAYQLQLNYCMGHRDSTMLLCPFGLKTSLINHSQKRPNVKLQWSDPKRSNHQPEWLDMPPGEFDDQATSILAMELVALKDIEEDEEILMDYGDEWDEAWKEHVKNWKPVKGVKSYESAVSLNEDTESLLRTVAEQASDPYPSTVELRYVPQTGAHTGASYQCQIQTSRRKYNGRGVYNAIVSDGRQQGLLKDIPRELFFFRDLPYTSDFHQKNVFRHDIRIPDHLFPEAWKNQKNGSTVSTAMKEEYSGLVVEIGCKDPNGRNCDAMTKTCDTTANSVIFKFRGGRCDESHNTQPKSCKESGTYDDSVDTVQIECWGEVNPEQIVLHDPLVFEAPEGDVLPVIECKCRSKSSSYMQELTIDPSKLYLGDRFGGWEVDSCNALYCVVDLEYTYTIKNTGITPLDMTNVKMELTRNNMTHPPAAFAPPGHVLQPGGDMRLGETVAGFDVCKGNSKASAILITTSL